MPSNTNLGGEEIVDAPGKDGNVSMPELVKRPNPWRKMMMMMMIYIYIYKYSTLFLYFTISVTVTRLRSELAVTVVCSSEVLCFYCHWLCSTDIAVGLLV